MLTVFFVWNMLVIGLAVGTAFVSLYVWFMTQRRDALIPTVGFAAYALLLGLIFLDKFLMRASDSTITFADALPHPVIMTILGIAVVGSVWMWVLVRVHAEVTTQMVLGPLVPFAAVLLVLMPIGTEVSTLQQWLYWFWRDLGLAASLLYALWRYRCRASELERLDIERSKPFFWVALALVALVVVEDSWTVLVWQYPSDTSLLATVLWCLSGRDVSETLLMVACACALLVRYHEVAVVFAQHPRADVPAGGSGPAVQEDNLESHIVIFGDAHGLSAREREVLTLVLYGVDNQGIAESLVVSQSTVKTHLHRIYVKAGVSGKDELIRQFWRW